MPTDRRMVAATLALSLLSLSAAWVIRQRAVAHPSEYIATDQLVYLAIARTPFADDPTVRHAPGSFRIFPALTARAIGDVTGIGPERGFFWLTYGSFALIPIATALFLRRMGVSADMSIGGAAIAALMPPLVGYGSWAVANPDIIGVLLVTLAAIATTTGRSMLLVLTIVVLSLTKESVLIAVWFALIWAALIDRRMIGAAVLSLVATLTIRTVLLPWLIPPAPEFPFRSLDGFYGMLQALSLEYVARRVLLASATTFNILLPIATVFLVRERWTRRGIVLWSTIAVAAAQILFASDTQRPVAAGYPFVLAAVALELDRLPALQRRVLAIVTAVAQLMWLVEYGRLRHVRGIRGIEIALFLFTCVVIVRTWRASVSSVWPSVAAQS